MEAGVSSSTISHDEANRGPSPRVFVSSVIEGLADYRIAARKGIEAAGLGGWGHRGDHGLDRCRACSFFDGVRRICQDAALIASPS